MRARFWVAAVLCLCPLALAGNKPAKHVKAAAINTPSNGTLPLTVHSAQARKLFENAIVEYENMRTPEALEMFRKAVKADPGLAQGWVLISFISKNPAEQMAAQKRAEELTARVSPGERLMVRWLSMVREDRYVDGISAMNDLVAMYPKDKRVAYMAAHWLLMQESYDHCADLLQRALALDPNYATALNGLGYTYAFSGDFEQARVMMERYIKALPYEPNPEDSYGEVLRMAGDFENALQHYTAAAKMDPIFPLLGMGDTYAVMGNQEMARKTYALAIAGTTSEADRLELAIQSAMTYVRENKLAEADAEFEKLTAGAHASGLHLHEAQIHRMMATYHDEFATANQHLEQGEKVLNESTKIPSGDRNEERSRILRMRVLKALASGNLELAQKSVAALAKMSEMGHDQIITRSYHAANGALLLHQGNAKEAVPHLQAGPTDAFTLQALSEAFEKSGQTDDANALRKKLAVLYTPTIDTAVMARNGQTSLAGGQ